MINSLLHRNNVKKLLNIYNLMQIRRLGIKLGDWKNVVDLCLILGLDINYKLKYRLILHMILLLEKVKMLIGLDRCYVQNIVVRIFHHYNGLKQQNHKIILQLWKELNKLLIS